MDCLFCKIIQGTIPSAAIYRDDLCFAFSDINPQAPVHFLVIPREHIPSLSQSEPKHAALLGHLLRTAADLAVTKGLGKGYRAVINTGEQAGQTVDHLHVHVLGGRSLAWPPG